MTATGGMAAGGNSSRFRQFTANVSATLATNGKDALQVLNQDSFDAIILDIMLPGCDGLSVLRQLRARKTLTPVLLLSARGHVDEPS